MRIGLITCETLPEPDPDEAPLLGALGEAGHDARMLAWDAPAADPSAFDVCLLRSCWNYYARPQAFLDWLELCPRLFNPLPVVRWNAHKRYLRELEQGGVPIIPTVWVARGETAPLPWDDVVIKPAVSAGSFRTQRFSAGPEAQAFLDRLAAERDVMVQPYMRAVETTGERALVWVDGVLTHGVRKSPRFGQDDERIVAAEPAPDERAFADRVLAEVDADLLYARIDVIRDDDGALRLSELELIEPSLFFAQGPDALIRLVTGTFRRGREPLE